MSNGAPVSDQATDGNHQGVDNAPAPPHGPDMSGNHEPLQDINLNETRLLV